MFFGNVQNFSKTLQIILFILITDYKKVQPLLSAMLRLRNSFLFSLPSSDTIPKHELEALRKIHWKKFPYYRLSTCWLCCIFR